MKSNSQYVSLCLKIFLASTIALSQTYHQTFIVLVITLLLLFSFLTSWKEAKRVSESLQILFKYLDGLSYTTEVDGTAHYSYQTKRLSAIEVEDRVLTLSKNGHQIYLDHCPIDLYIFNYSISDWSRIDVAVFRFNGDYHFYRKFY
jgi:hypothetical protein